MHTNAVRTSTEGATVKKFTVFLSTLALVVGVVGVAGAIPESFDINGHGGSSVNVTDTGGGIINSGDIPAQSAGILDSQTFTLRAFDAPPIAVAGSSNGKKKGTGNNGNPPAQVPEPSTLLLLGTGLLGLAATGRKRLKKKD